MTAFTTRPLATAASGPALCPYLARLDQRYPEAAQEDWRAVLEAALTATRAAAQLPDAEAARALRQAKGRVHLTLALADLTGAATLEEVTRALSDLADAAMQTALTVAAREAAPRDQALWQPDASGDPAMPGLFILAMGKHGAQELNYSSDIDLAAFFDRDALPQQHQDSAIASAVRLIGAASRLLEDITADGYVFRVDWRLRPDPSSTKLAVSVQMAENYYETVGQNWERAALIKARAIAGAAEPAASFLRTLQPFIWRKHLDFAAIADVQSILRQIHGVRRPADLIDPAFDVKLGRGGIREIEFFVQTQQLILGGRDPSLRVRGTVAGLDALVAAGRIDRAVRDDLATGYRFWRNLEHRIQMREDGHTHRLPADPAYREAVAALAGFGSLPALDEAVRQCREMVRARVRELFPETTPLSSASGSLVFTGVDDDPETLATLRGMGFADPATVSAGVRGWHHGRVPATRTPRARELLTALMPQLLDALAATGEPDAAFLKFRDFFGGLTAGVQVLSLFQAEPAILRDVCATLALAPRLAVQLARRPAIIDAMLSPHFQTPVSAQEAPELAARFAQEAAGAAGFEAALDAIRRVHRDEAFRIGWQILHGRLGPLEAGEAWTGLAEACVAALLPVAIAEVAAVHGPLDVRFAVCGWGKLGGRELAADSDLDLMVVYDCADGLGPSAGRRPLEPDAWATKVTQKLVTALSAPTAEGGLYEVDMQLRPSGRAGPVAVRLGALQRYYREGEAWLWEVQALTRLRPLCGNAALCRQIEGLRAGVLNEARPAGVSWPQIAAMRAKMAAAHPPRGAWDVKRGPGGLIDLEFLAQAQVLAHAPTMGHGVCRQSTESMLEQLCACGALAPDQAAQLRDAGRLLHAIRQLLAVASGPAFDPQQAPAGLVAALNRALAVPGLPQASALHADIRQQVGRAWSAVAATAATEPPP
jgi:[glutamine synthetase] adenylyltransferase / [glutamine synthetase]-adenylyl-L-tyrosine phosphorylase